MISQTDQRKVCPAPPVLPSPVWSKEKHDKYMGLYYKIVKDHRLNPDKPDPVAEINKDISVHQRDKYLIPKPDLSLAA